MNTSTTSIDSKLRDATSASEQGVDHLSETADRSIQRSRRLANDTFDQLSNAVESARASAVPALERLGAGAESLARRSIDVARARSQQLREQANLRSEQAVGYIREEPVKSVLIAAATGAAVAIVLSLFTRSSDRR